MIQSLRLHEIAEIDRPKYVALGPLILRGEQTTGPLDMGRPYMKLLMRENLGVRIYEKFLTCSAKFSLGYPLSHYGNVGLNAGNKQVLEMGQLNFRCQ
jgi:hypothetical protein